MNFKASLRSVYLIREHRRDLQNSLVSSLFNYAAFKVFAFSTASSIVPTI
ncbi:MAG TPA: palindromic element RPE3 domain-containing protein [Rickettsia endosymbiont of Diachasma alloeum]|nr:palindromic element RPE3 domain-containing protein [Rickettsia endosymbiont of Diachasma alloeum]